MLISLMFIVGCDYPGEKIEMGVKCNGVPYKYAIEAVENSECVEEGKALYDIYTCNENTNTMWIDLDLEKDGCNPACVVDLETRTAEINWMCTGDIE